ncbi:MAG: ATP-dependent helicase [Eubacteriales bacterium]|nr:ATP-dependent helicase [Eubacteriales bacterium]
MNCKKTNSFNEAQQTAVIHKDGPMMVLAGPGSGKTFVLVEHISYLTKTYGIDPESLLVITFTREAAKEMKERAMKKGADTRITFGTFHSVFLSILKEYCGYKVSDIVERKFCIQLMRKILNSGNYKGFENATSDMAEYVINIIGRMKNGEDIFSIIENKAEAGTYICIYKKYESEMRKYNKIDYDDMLLLCRNLLVENKSILAKLRNRYKYFLIDEFQDINELQFEIIKLMSYPYNNLFIVGDDDQSIYGFRGSRPEIMLNFESEYRDVQKVVLNINYRSSQAIVDASLKLIENNEIRYKKLFKAAKKGGRAVRIEGFADEREMLDTLCKELILMHNGNIKYSDFAVLYRVNKNAVILTKYLNEYAIPFTQNEKNDENLALMTFHASKGLEFNQVYIIFATEGICPWKSSVSKAEISEERRMFYVAMTRAKAQLHIFYTKKLYNAKVKKSRFIDEILR